YHFFVSCADLRYLLSFPTRRSSDLCCFRRGGFFLGWTGPTGGDPRNDVVTCCPFSPPRPRRGPHACRRLYCGPARRAGHADDRSDRKSTRLNSSHVKISYAVFCLKK